MSTTTSNPDLRTSQAVLWTLVRSAPMCIAMLDREMNYLAASELWLRTYGHGRSDLIGLNIAAVHPDIPERWKEAYRQGLAGETTKCDDDSWIQADGSKRWMSWIAMP